MEEELKEQAEISKAERIAPWQFKKGQSGNPAGRPPGKSLKERARVMLQAMTPEEEQEFLMGIDKRTIWEMAEGKAKQDMSAEVNATMNVIVPVEVAKAFEITPTKDEFNTEASGSNTEQV